MDLKAFLYLWQFAEDLTEARQRDGSIVKYDLHSSLLKFCTPNPAEPRGKGVAQRLDKMKGVDFTGKLTRYNSDFSVVVLIGISVLQCVF